MYRLNCFIGKKYPMSKGLRFYSDSFIQNSDSFIQILHLPLSVFLGLSFYFCIKQFNCQFCTRSNIACLFQHIQFSLLLFRCDNFDNFFEGASIWIFVFPYADFKKCPHYRMPVSRARFSTRKYTEYAGLEIPVKS